MKGKTSWVKVNLRKCKAKQAELIKLTWEN